MKEHFFGRKTVPEKEECTREVRLYLRKKAAHIERNAVHKKKGSIREGKNVPEKECSAQKVKPRLRGKTLFRNKTCAFRKAYFQRSEFFEKKA